MSYNYVARTGLILGLTVAFCALALVVSSRAHRAGAQEPGLQSSPALLVSDCLEVDVGEQFELSIRASGAANLLAWEVYFAYNRHLLEIMGRDVHKLLDTGRQPNVVDVSDPVPNSTGFYRIGAADLGPGDTPKQGDVLVQLTLQAKAEGVSPSNIYRGDYNGDGSIDFGPNSHRRWDRRGPSVPWRHRRGPALRWHHLLRSDRHRHGLRAARAHPPAR